MKTRKEELYEYMTDVTKFTQYNLKAINKLIEMAIQFDIPIEQIKTVYALVHESGVDSCSCT